MNIKKWITTRNVLIVMAIWLLLLTVAVSVQSYERAFPQGYTPYPINVNGTCASYMSPDGVSIVEVCNGLPS